MRVRPGLDLRAPQRAVPENTGTADLRRAPRAEGIARLDPDREISVGSGRDRAVGLGKQVTDLSAKPQGGGQAGRLDTIASDPALMERLNPADELGLHSTQNCPATAAAAAQYLYDGTVSPASHASRFDLTGNRWSGSRSLSDISRSLRPGDFVVVHGHRTEAGQRATGYSPDHYFLLANRNGQLTLVDPMMHTTYSGAQVRQFIDYNQLSTLRTLERNQTMIARPARNYE